ncbi:MAG TPA: carboxypeptidase regulatory-like domain-containing protein [Pyrinomonadaceae bacterium]
MFEGKLTQIRQALILSLLIMILSAAAAAQTVTGTVKGTVLDVNGAIVVGASVEIVNTDTGLKRNLTTGNDGSYIATFLPLGSYRVTASQTGFGVVTRENVEVLLNQTSQVDFKLDPSVTAEVTITDEPAPINTTNAQIAGSLTSEQILERPVANQTNFLTLAETFTGFQENPTSGQNNPTSSSGSSVNFNGTGTRGATFQINGVNNDDSSENQNRQGVSLATIKEFQVITNNFTAEFGRGYGAVVLVQTLSGTNNLRGSAYIFHNDSALNAKSFFSHGKKPVARRNQFGVTAGFPILRNRLFGFVSFDRLENTGSNTYTRDVFLPSERDPANWFRITPANDTPANRAFIQSVINRFPATLLPNDPANRSPRTYVGEQGFDFPAEDYSGRFDWNPRQSDTVFARYQYTRQQFIADDIIIGERADQNNKQQNLGVTWTHIFNPQLVGEFRYGLGLRTTLVNITAGNDTPIIRFFNPVSIGSSIIGNSAAFPIQRYQTDNQFVYNLSATLGSRHFLKLGTDIRDQKLDDLADNSSRGFYNFNATTCNGVTYGSGFTAFLNGCVNNYQKGYGNFFLENRIGESNFYAEDNWRILSNLTLNLGVRYEYVNAPRERNNKIDYQYNDDRDNIEPRLGFAYSPSFEDGILSVLFGQSGDSSIRGGYGIYHGRLFQSVFAQSGASVRTNTPNAFFYNQTGAAGSGFFPTNLQDPTGGFVFVPGVEPTARYSKSLVVDPNLEMPYTKQWNLTYERQLPWSSALRISYTGNRGYGLLRYNFGNAPLNDPNGVLVTDHPNNAPSVLYTAPNRTPGDPRGVDVRGQILRPAANVLCAGTGLPNVPVTTQCPVAVPLGPLEYSFRIPRTNERRPDGRFAGNLEVSNGAFTWYDGLQVELSKRLSNGLNFQAAYTWSKSMDTTSEVTAVGTGDTNQTGNDLKQAKALSRFHTPHRFTFFGTYRIPFLADRKDIIGQVLGGWQISTVFKWVHGTPFTVTGTGVDLNFDNFAESRPALLDPSILGRTIGNPETSVSLLPASAFRQATLADLNCCILGRNTFYIDGVKNVDLALSKKFLMPFERHSLSVRADFFNAFNRVQWGFPNLTYTSSAFGQITGTATQYAPRTIQFSLRYLF